MNYPFVKRLTNNELPPYRFLPGQSNHPEKHGYMKGKVIETEKVNSLNFKTHNLYLYSIDLYNLAYYWEAHVYLEVIWNKEGRVGKTADFLKAIIKLSASLIQLELKKNEPAKTHLERANELLVGIQKENYLGLSLKELPFNKAPKILEIQL